MTEPTSQADERPEDPKPASKQGNPEVRKRLGLDQRKRPKWLGRIVVLAVVGLIVVAIAWRVTRKPPPPSYVTAPSVQGVLKVTVVATGSLDALETVDVGAETSGRVLEVLVDFNDPVEAGQPLLRLDTEQLEARVDETKAQLVAANASVRSAVASAKEARLAAKRSGELFEKQLASEAQLEQARAAAARAQASVSSASAQATVARASLKAAEAARDRATVTSPIDGIVLSRNVEAGQTLASQFQVPVLFRIAKDLRQMELAIQIDEADVAKVVEGQEASFTVDAYEARTFPSKVISLRNVPTTDQNVVTYEAILSVDNEQRLLRPGMTATATIVTSRKEDVLIVPNAALRFTPPEVLAKEEALKKLNGGKDEAPEDESLPFRVWTLDDDGQAKAIAVSIGATDGSHTEVTGGDLKPDTPLIVDLEEPKRR